MTTVSSFLLISWEINQSGFPITPYLAFALDLASAVTQPNRFEQIKSTPYVPQIAIAMRLYFDP